MRTIALHISFFLTLISFQYCQVHAQQDSGMLDQSIAKDTALNAIALYPLELRTSILKVCGEAEGLLKMENLQKNSRERFRKILAAYPKEEQEKLWDLSRYPGLAEKLVNKGDRKKDKIEPLLKDYPKEIHETALAYGVSHYSALEAIHILDKGIKEDFENIIRKYPAETQTAFRNVLAHPEVIELLGSNMHMTVLWGDVHKRDPKLVKNKLDSMSTALAAKNAKSLQEWKEGLEKDPKAKKEFEESAKEYAKEQGYSETELRINDPDVINVYVHPYPYWYGTPWWWDHPRWYPYPYWYDWGYYYGPHGIVYIGYPSWYYMNWYFYNPYHHHHYAYFSDYCIDHYYGHRGSYTPVHRTVSGWVNENQGRLPSDFAGNKEKRVERLQEIGRFEQDYRQAVKTVPDRMSKDEFLRDNASRYPNLRQPSGMIKTEPGVPAKERMEPVKPQSHEKEVITPLPSEPRVKSKPEQRQPNVQPSPKVQPKTQKPQPGIRKPPSQPRPQAPRSRKGPGG